MEYRPKFHFSARKGWLNDPNGLLWDGAQYQLFYQHNPHHCNWDSMHWGHATSTDLLHWAHLPPMLYPDAPYDKHQSGGCFSGSVVQHEGALYLFYTGALSDPTVQTQNLAISRDGGKTAQKYSGNPIIAAPPQGMSQADFRDPKVIAYGGSWYMLLATHTGSNQQDGEGRILLYRSADLLHWDYISVLFGSAHYGSMYECPDLFPMGEQWVLSFSPMYHPEWHQSVWLLGDMDFERGVFTVARAGRTDYGFDYYAAQSYPDQNGQIQSIGWMGSWPWMPWFRGYGPTEQEGWRCALSLPRSCALDRAGRLCWQPARAVESLRRQEQCAEHLELRAVPVGLDGGENCYECSLMLRRSALGEGIRLTLFAEQERGLTLDILPDTLLLSRARADGYGTGTAQAPLYWEDGAICLRIIVDKSTVELFAGEGAVCMSANVYPREGQSGITLRALGEAAQVQRLSLWQLDETKEAQ